MAELIYHNGELYHAEDFSDEFLAHYGVKGMKWGKRKSSSDSGSKRKSATRVDKKADRREKRMLRSALGRASMQNNMVADRINPFLDKLNNKPEYKNVDLNKNPKLYKKYVSEYEKQLLKVEKEVNAEIVSKMRKHGLS